jgi:hypothetical protein
MIFLGVFFVGSVNFQFQGGERHVYIHNEENQGCNQEKHARDKQNDDDRSGLYTEKGYQKKGNDQEGCEKQTERSKGDCRAKQASPADHNIQLTLETARVVPGKLSD